MNPGKSPGIDGIPAEVYQYGGEKVTVCLHDLFIKCWEQGLVPQDLRDAIIVSLYKNKGVKSDCSNYRGITLLSIAGKVLARRGERTREPVWLPGQQRDNRHGLRTPPDPGEVPGTKQGPIRSFHRPDQGLWYSKQGGSVVLRQIQEKCREQNKGLFVAFIDLTKAFDTVSREGLWKILAHLGCPPKFLTILCHRPDQGLWYSKQGGSVENPGASWLPSKVPHHFPP